MIPCDKKPFLYRIDPSLERTNLLKRPWGNQEAPETQLILPRFPRFPQGCLSRFFLLGRGLHGFAESLQHYIKPQISLTSLYGSFSALNLPYNEVTEF